MTRVAEEELLNTPQMEGLRKNLLTAEAIIKAEPQVLVFWEQGQDVRVMAHTLGSVAGLPQQHAELLKFGKWLDLASAQDLKNGLDALFSDGRPFSSLLKTVAGGHVEADGRAAGGRAILRLRDIAGWTHSKNFRRARNPPRTRTFAATELFVGGSTTQEKPWLRRIRSVRIVDMCDVLRADVC